MQKVMMLIVLMFGFVLAGAAKAQAVSMIAVDGLSDRGRHEHCGGAGSV